MVWRLLRIGVISEDLMISKNFVMVVSLLALFQVSLIGCGQKSSGNKVTSTRGKKPDPNSPAAKAAAAAKEKADAEKKAAGKGGDSATGGSKGTVPKPGILDPDSPSGKNSDRDDDEEAGSHPETGKKNLPKILTDKEAVKEILIKNKCEAYYERVQKEGWEITISIKGSGNGDAISFMKPKGSQLKNPVLVLSNPRSEMSAEESDKILKLAKQYNFDPIVFDVPGFGCSDKLPNLGSQVSASELQRLTSQSVATAIEENRSVILKEEKWKIWANGNASLIALRMIEKYPNTISSAHLADFVFSDQPVELMKKRILKQAESWKTFKTFAKGKDLEITEDLMKKVNETLNKQTCSSNQKICKKSLLSVLVTFLSQDDNKWEDAVKAVKLLSTGSIPETLNQRAVHMQKNYLYDQLVKATDLDSDVTLSACEKALKDTEVIEALKESPINSCQLEVELKEDYKALSSKITHQKLDYALIKKNFADKKIKLHLAIGDRSVMNPLGAVEDMSRLIGDELVNDNLIDPKDGSFLFMNETLLKNLE